MKSRSTVIALVLFLLLGAKQTNAQTSTGDSLTLRQAIELALANTPAIKAASARMLSAGEKVEQSKSDFIPTTEVNLSYLRLDPLSAYGLPGIGVLDFAPYNNLDAHLSVEATLYDFGKRDAGIELNKHGVEAVTTDAEYLRTLVAYETIKAFYSILFLKRSMDVQDEEIASLTDHLEVTKKKSAAGSVTDFDVLTTQVRIASGENKKYDIDNDLQKQEILLRRLLGLPGGALVNLSGDFHESPAPMNADSLSTIAFAQRLELVQAHDAEKSAELQQDIIKHKDLPSVHAGVEYGFKNGFFPDLDVYRGNFAGGVTADIPVFTGYHTQHEEEESKADLEAAQEHTHDVERAVSADVQQALADLRTNAGKIETSSLQVEEAKAALDLAEKRYESGVSTNLDLIDAQTALAEAQLSHLDALHKFVLSRFALQKAIGEDLTRVDGQ
jgi:outer membrane protein TolC